jgi:hypothetical protein
LPLALRLPRDRLILAPDRRVDGSAMGPRTVAAGGAILAQAAEVARTADREKVFVIGVNEEQP